MARIAKPLGAACGMLLAFAGPAHAHVDYFDLSANLFVNAAGQSWDQEIFTNYGWYDGTQPTLGDSHALAGGVFFKFHLDQASKVSIEFSDLNRTGTLNPAFSLYAGLLPAESHDDTATDPLNPAHLVTTPVPHAVKDPSPVDDGVTTDASGRVSPFRDTAHVSYVGQFDALGDWSMANEAGEWSVIEYLTHAGPNGTDTVSLLDWLLPAGDYTIAAGGGTAGGSISGVAGVVLFKASPVPVPAAVWLFGSALCGLGGRRIRARQRT